MVPASRVSARWIVGLAVLSLAGSLPAAPNATKSEYLRTTGAGISIAGGDEPLFYSLMLRVRVDRDEPIYLEVLYERPGKPDEPMVSREVIEPDDDSVFLESKRFQGIENGETYRVIVILYSDEARENEISRHIQDVEFNVPKKVLKKLDVELL